MMDICLAEYPEEESPIAFLVAAMPGERTPLVNPLYAEFISSMLRRSGVVDVQANILADLYHNGQVMRENVPHLRETLASLEPAAVLAAAIYRAHREGRVAKRIVDIMRRIQEQTELQRILFLDKDGLFAETVYTDGGLPLCLDDDFAESFGHDSLAENTARRLNLNAFVFEKELVWRAGRSGLQAVLLSDCDHTALGRMDPQGNFEHVVTVLSPDHPIHQDGIALDY